MKLATSNQNFLKTTLNRPIINIFTKIQLLEENLDRADENVSRLTNELGQVEMEREEAKHNLRTLENSESQIAEKADTQVFFIKYFR